MSSNDSSHRMPLIEFRLQRSSHEKKEIGNEAVDVKANVRDRKKSVFGFLNTGKKKLNTEDDIQGNVYEWVSQLDSGLKPDLDVKKSDKPWLDRLLKDEKEVKLVKLEVVEKENKDLSKDDRINGKNKRLATSISTYNIAKSSFEKLERKRSNSVQNTVDERYPLERSSSGPAIGNVQRKFDHQYTSNQLQDPKKFWMPDKSVTSCYECGIQFTIFKRKHHCRICGQIFCNSCCNDFVDGSKWGYTGKVRRCNYCAKSEKEKLSKSIVNAKTQLRMSKGISNFSLFNSPSHEDIEKQKNSNEFVNIAGAERIPDSEVSLTVSPLPESKINSLYHENLDSTQINHLKEDMEDHSDIHIESLDSHAEQHLQNLISELAGQANIDPEWEEIIFSMALKAIDQLKIDPNRGDLMDIRQYIKIKEIDSDSDILEAKYFDGVAFTGNVCHRKMKHSFVNPKILLFKSPINFHRQSNTLVNMETLMQQERDYLRLQVDRITEKKPDIIFVHDSVGSLARTQLLKSNIALVLKCKLSVLKRISRSAQIPILNSVDELHAKIDGEIPVDIESIDVKRLKNGKSVMYIRSNNRDTMATILLYGRNLNKVKKILRFAIYVAYNLSLETNLLSELCGTYMDVEFKKSTLSVSGDDVDGKCFPLLSASMHADISLSNVVTKNLQGNGEFITPYSHQNIVLLFYKLMSEDQSEELPSPEIIVIAHYTENDMTLGNYLMKKCFNAEFLKSYYRRCYMHGTGKITIDVVKSDKLLTKEDEGIGTWAYCKKCNRFVTPLRTLSESSFNYSFGKFLELMFYNETMKCRTGECPHSAFHDHTRYFAYKSLIAKFNYAKINVKKIFIPPTSIRYDAQYQKNAFMRMCTTVKEQCLKVFALYNQFLKSMKSERFRTLMQEIEVQQKSLLHKLEGKVMPQEHIYTLNNFIRKFHLMLKNWNGQINECNENITNEPVKVIFTVKENEENPIKVKLIKNPLYYMQNRNALSGDSQLPSGVDSIFSGHLIDHGENVFVYDQEPSSIIAYTLYSKEYHDGLQNQEGMKTVQERLLSQEKVHIKQNISTSVKTGKTSTKTTIVTCTCYFVKQFSAVREIMCENEDDFIQSLCRCINWTPTGGKSGSVFTKTWDDRYVIKQVHSVELQSFLDNGLSYFKYLSTSLFQKLPSSLVKILGIYKISYYHKKKTIKRNFIVTENLFYNRNISAIYDLKGSQRNRYQKTEGAVKLDENLLQKMKEGDNFVVGESEKNILNTSIFNDTLFLSKLNVMDYSLLVGVDDEKGEFVVGIIDYVRQYTWDKKMETWVKSATIISNKRKIPTVISPRYYKTRFRKAIDSYFISEVGKGLALTSDIAR